MRGGDGVSLVTMPPPAADQASLAAYVQAHVDFFEDRRDMTSIQLPPGPGRTPADLAEYRGLATGRSRQRRCRSGRR